MAAINERLAPVEPTYYTWSFPGSPIRVHLELGSVRKVQGRLQHKSDSGEWGILLGAIDGATTVVSAFQPLPPLAKGEASEAKRIASALAAVPPTRSVVGFYRTQVESGLRLNEKDTAVAEALFRDPHHVFLLIQPMESGPANASFFFWDGGRLNGDFPFLEFPFDAELLASSERHKSEAVRRRIADRQAPLPSAPPAVPPPVRSSHPVLKGAAWTLAALILIGAAAIGGRWLPQNLVSFLSPRPPAPQASALQSAPSMGLQAERQNGDLRLTWNRSTAIISDATSGILLIQDGPARRELPLQASQVQSGSILYSPVSDQVQMQLSVSGPAGSASETVIVINPRVGTPQVQTLNVQSAPARPPARLESETGSASRVQASRPFVPPASSRRTAQAPVPALEAPPVLQAGASAVPMVSALITARPPGPRPPTLSAAPGSGASTSAPVVSPTVYPPETIRQVMPKFPIALRMVVLKPKSVEVVVSIDETGKVVKAEAVPQKDVHQMLINAATDAARQWRFRPGRRGNQPVPSEMVLRFNFKPSV